MTVNSDGPRPIFGIYRLIAVVDGISSLSRPSADHTLQRFSRRLVLRRTGRKREHSLTERESWCRGTASLCSSVRTICRFGISMWPLYVETIWYLVETSQLVDLKCYFLTSLIHLDIVHYCGFWQLFFCNIVISCFSVHVCLCMYFSVFWFNNLIFFLLS